MVAMPLPSPLLDAYGGIAATASFTQPISLMRLNSFSTRGVNQTCFRCFAVKY